MPDDDDLDLILNKKDITPEEDPGSDSPDPLSLDTLTQDLISLLKSSSQKSIFNIETDPHEEDPPTSKPLHQSVDHIQFDQKPKDIKAYLDRFIIKQDEAKKMLSIAVCDHLHQIKAARDGNPTLNYAKQNVIMIGPTGVGKTYMIKCIADFIGIPFIKSDATKFTETGYQGGDVEDLVRQLLTKADNNTELAQYGIIYLDEIDKIAASSQKMGKDVSGRGVQSNLLKLMEETDVSTKAAWDMQSQIKNMMNKKQSQPDTISTKFILFIVSGAFVGLDDITRKRMEGSKIGFERNKRTLSQQDLLQNIRTEDLVHFGLEPEFVGRLPVRVSCEHLSEDDLYHILLSSEGSLLTQYIDAFKHYGIHVHFKHDALKQLSHLAFQEKTGARGLGTVFESIFRDFKFELPSSDVTHFVVTKALINTPKQYLKKLLKSPQNAKTDYFEALIDAFESDYYLAHKVLIHFDSDLRNTIIDQHHAPQPHSIPDICQSILSPLRYGLALLEKKKIKSKLIINEALLKDSTAYLDQWIKQHFPTQTRSKDTRH